MLLKLSQIASDNQDDNRCQVSGRLFSFFWTSSLFIWSVSSFLSLLGPERLMLIMIPVPLVSGVKLTHLSGGFLQQLVQSFWSLCWFFILFCLNQGLIYGLPSTFTACNRPQGSIFLFFNSLCFFSSPSACLLQVLIIEVNRCSSPGYFTPIPTLCHVTLTLARGDDCSASLARNGISTMQAQGDHVSMTARCYAPCCHLLLPPSNNILLLSVMPSRLLVTEIKGRHNYSWGKLKHCLLKANWILPQSAGQFRFPPATRVMSWVNTSSVLWNKSFDSQNHTVLYSEPDAACSSVALSWSRIFLVTLMMDFGRRYNMSHTCFYIPNDGFLLSSTPDRLHLCMNLSLQMLMWF